ncbi:MAG: PQQ-binding-like beta-propeller repeat protein, partial [Actinobacteria bacterium]|nr:PQQ-binding-like beta-propeller repeat protein [Actinomycetota bacterium]
PKWTFTTAPGTGVWATPTLAGGIVYFIALDEGKPGYLYAANAATGKQIWSDYIPDLSPLLPADASTRTSPVVFGDELIFGDQHNGTGTGAHLIAVNRFTGKLKWITTVDSQVAAQITGSPVVLGSVVYGGTSSSEEALDGTSYPCCTFRGQAFAVNAVTGKIIWQTYTIPDNGGVPGAYSGGAVYGTTLVPDAQTGLLYLGTGNNYSVPPGVCQEADSTDCTPVASDDYIDAVLALSLKTGAVEWVHRTVAADTFPIPFGPDVDFASGPNLYTARVNGHPTQLLGIGQKSGVYYALNPATGAEVWHTVAGSGSPLGGIEWGSATDGNRIYVAEANLFGQPWTLQGSGPDAGQTITGGYWSALDAATGKILWQTPDPANATGSGFSGGLDMGLMSTANGVVYAGSDAGTMYALDAATGNILWHFDTAGSVIGGPAIVNGTLFWGDGYWVGSPGENNKLYAFSLSS